MPSTIWFLLGFLSATLIAWLFRRHGMRTIRHLEKERHELLTEESRVFSFLHEMGDLLAKDRGLRPLYDEIASGVARVVGADCAALYLIDARHPEQLTPMSMTVDAAPVVHLPEASLTATAHELGSWLRRTLVPLEGCLLGRCFTSQAALQTGPLHDAALWGAPLGTSQAGAAFMFAPVTTGSRKLGVLAVVQHAGKEPFTAHEFDVFRSAAEQCAFALASALTQQEAVEKRRIEQELRAASEVQSVLLPRESPPVPGYRIVAANLPARVMSGDYYDYIPLEGERTGVVIADVSGKGVAASLVMATCRALVRGVAQTRGPSEALAMVNRRLWGDMREDMFISMAYCILEAHSPTVTMCRAGHDAPLHYIHATGEVHALKTPGLALGVDSGKVFDRVSKDHTFTMAPGDCLLLYTDGVNEAENPEGEQYGMERLIQVLAATAPAGPQAVLDTVRSVIKEHAGTAPQNDDITIIVIQRDLD